MEKLLKDYENRIINKLHGVRVDLTEPLDEAERNYIESCIFFNGKTKSIKDIIKYNLPVPLREDNLSLWTVACAFIVTLDGVHVDDCVTRGPCIEIIRVLI